MQNEKAKIAIQFKDDGKKESGKFAEIKFDVNGASNYRQFRLGKKDGNFASHISHCDSDSGG